MDANLEDWINQQKDRLARDPITGYARGEAATAEPVSIAGFLAPEIPDQVAALTLGVEQERPDGWDWNASVTYTYRGDFFTDEFNTPFAGDPEGEPLELNQNQQTTIPFFFEFENDWNTNVSILAFVQNKTTKEVLQAGWTRFPKL